MELNFTRYNTLISRSEKVTQEGFRPVAVTLVISTRDQLNEFARRYGEMRFGNYTEYKSLIGILQERLTPPTSPADSENEW